VFGVREEGVTVGSIRRFKGGRFLAIALLDFCTRQRELIGIQNSNHRFARVEQTSSDGMEIFLGGSRARFCYLNSTGHSDRATL
jgi:hypothetical protein